MLNCVVFDACWNQILVISAVLVNHDGLQHVGPLLKGLTEAEISGQVSELVTGC